MKKNFYLFLVAMLGIVSFAMGQCDPGPTGPQLLPFGSEGVRTNGETPTDGDLVLEVIFVDWADAPAPTTDTDADFDELWSKITSNGELTESFKRQGFKGNLIVNIQKEWKRMPKNRSAYFFGNRDWDFRTYIDDSAPLIGEGPFSSNTIAVVVPDEGVDFGGVGSGAHTNINYNGIRTMVTVAPGIYNDSYTIMLHEIGHCFGSPDLYPLGDDKVHLVGGYGMMADARGARNFLGYHLFRYGWLAEGRTSFLNKQGTYNIDLAKIANTSGQSMIVIPDPNVYAKLWVVEIGQDILKQDDFKEGNDNYLNKEGDRLIVYTVEGNPSPNLRPIQLDFRTAPPDPENHLSTEWLDAVSYVAGQSLTSADAPFKMDVLTKTNDGFQIQIELETDLEGGRYQNLEDQFSPNEEFVLRFQSVDGNIGIYRNPSGDYVWDAVSAGWFTSSCSTCRFSYENGVIQRIDNATGNVVDQHIIQADAPAASFLGVNDEGEPEIFPCMEVSANLPTITIAESEASSLNEGNDGMTALAFNVSRSGTTEKAWNYFYSVRGNGENPADSMDFVDVNNGMGLIAAGESSATLEIMVNGDVDIESDETFLVTLLADSTYELLPRRSGEELGIDDEDLLEILSRRAAEGTIINDDSNINDGTLCMEVSYDLTPANCVEMTQSTIWGLNFDGEDDFIQSQTTGALLKFPLTVEAWVNPELRDDGNVGNPASEYPNNVISNDTPGRFGHGFGANVNADENIITVEYENGFRYIRDAGLQVDTWQHIACVYTDGNVKTYLNGQLIDDFDFTQSPLDANPTFIMGKHNDDNFNYGTKRFFKGSIDEVRVWDSALTQQEIEDNRFTTLTGNEQSLALYFSFEDGAGSAATDLESGDMAVFNNMDPDTDWVQPGAPVSAAPIVADENTRIVFSSTPPLEPGFTIEMMGPQGVTTYEENTIYELLPAGAYSFIVTNADGCMDTIALEIEVALDENGAPCFATEVGCDSTLTIIAGIDAASTCPETAVMITAADLLANDMASDGDSLEVQELILNNAADGELVDNQDGTWTFTPAAGFIGDVALSYIVKRADNSLYFSETGHFYEFVAGQDIAWTDARDAAAASTLNGLQGYLATITSSAENDFIQTKLQGRGWLGGREVSSITSGEWRWVTGPEGGMEEGLGLQFWDGNIGGNAIPGVYQNWREGEPNNADTGEEFLHIRFDVAPGKWNDYPLTGFGERFNGNERIEGYIVEYGGLEDCQIDFTTTGTLIISLAANCEECEACPGDNTPPAITCPEDITLTATEFAELQNLQESIFGGFESEYEQADTSLGQMALYPTGTWIVTSNPNAHHDLFDDCDDADGNPDGEMLVFNGAPETGVAVYCQSVDVVAGTTYNMSVMVASVEPFSPAMIQFAVGDEPQGEVHNASATTCVWTELATSWTATTSGSVRICILNQNDAGGGNDFALDNFSIATEDGTELSIGMVLGVATATDDCGPVTPTFVDSEAVSECETIITRTWTAVDSCGNQSTCEQIITVKNDENPACTEDSSCEDCTDTTPPVFDDFDIFIEGECGEISIEDLGITATDNCGDVTITFEETKFSPGCLGTLQRTYTATDKCGNTATVIQIIDLTNENGPIMECLADTTYDCIADVPVAVDPIVTHGCDLEIVSIELNETMQGENCAMTITREWTATDACGSVSTCTQTITVNDMEAPGPPADAPGPLAVQCADDVPVAETLTAEDNCSGTVTGVPTDVRTDGDCPNSFVITRTWTFTDECGNASAVNQTITVEDTEAPVAPEAPAPIAVQCADDVPAAAELTATDNCSGTITGVPTDVRTDGDCPNSFVVTRTWTFTDECDNSSTVSRTITVEDTEAPVAPEAPAPIAVQCADDVPTAAELTATDNCSGTITGVPTGVRTDGDCPNSFVITRTWTFTDECDNSSTVSQTITVEDTEAPVAPEAPAPIAVQCSDDVPAAAELTATDNCSGTITGVPTDVRTDGDCPNSFMVTRTWTFTDECDNVSSVSRTITVEDTEAPVAPEAPAPIAVQCADDVPTATELTATDNCSGTITGVPTDVRTDGDCPNSFMVTRTWTFTDECDNSSTVSQTITVEDTEAPVAPEAPAPIAVQCADDVPAAAELTATDNCSGTITGIPTDVRTDGDCPNSFVITRTWTFTDECGNESSVNTTIGVSDTEAPVAPEAPAPIAVQCADDVPAAAELTATDNCSGTITGIPTDVRTDGDCPNSFVVTRTWTFTDECNNVSSVSQTITVEDTEAPVAPVAPAPIAVQCADDVPAAAELTATDNCSGTITGVPIDVRTDGDCPNSFVVTRTWTFTDECDNSSTVSQTITVEDTEAPVAPEAPAPIAVQCAGDVPTAAELTATDNCSGTITGVPTDVRTDGDCPNSFVVTRTWTFTDECNNSSTVSQTITVEDTEAPVAPEAPAPIAVQCADDVPTAGVLTAEDNCSGTITGVPTDVRTDGDCPNSFVVTRTWTFTDECNNSSMVSQTITVEDTEAPVAPAAPVPVTIECDEEIPSFEPVFTDNCDEEVDVEITEAELPNECGFTFVRTFVATDDCGNSTTISQIVIVTDTEAPTFPVAPADVTIECADDITDLDIPEAIDNCQTPEVTCVETADLDECGNGVILVTCTADDGCGNLATTSYTITVRDTTAPELVGVPGDLVLDCDAEIPVAPEVTAIDNCDDEVIVTFSQDTIDGLPVNCVLSQPADPCHDTENWSMVLFDLPETEYYSTVEANFVEFPDGTAQLTGTVSDNTNSDGGFIIDVMFEQGMSWEEWSNQDFPTNFKDECGTGNHEDWTYYLITPGEATLTGYGNLAGSQFNLIHAPVNKLFAYQVGVGASNVNSNFGNGGWFIAQGNLVVDGENFPNLMVAGDFAFDQDCCPSFEVERTWTATDCSGNTTEATQRITFDNIDEEGGLDAVVLKDLNLNPNSNLLEVDRTTDISLSRVAPNPAFDHASFSYVLNKPMHVLIDIIDTNGSLIQKVFEGNASADFEHVHQIQTGNMASGVYLIRVTSEKKMTFTRLVVTN